MKLWAVESGTLWLSEAASGPPPVLPARVETTFGEVDPHAWDDLLGVLDVADPAPIRRRFESGRRCFWLRVGDDIAAYGWATRGPETVGELERDFCVRDDELYIWDCVTLPAWRGQKCYTSLLTHMRRQFYGEGAARTWIGASRQNQPSVQGIARAGFQHVVDVVYRRCWRVTSLWFTVAPAAPRAQLDAAYRVLMTPHERRWGRVALGIYHGAS